MILLRKYWLHIAIAAIVAVLVLTLAWKLWKPKSPIQETYHGEVKQPDGSIQVEVKPDAKAKPAHMIPEGGKVERIVKMTVKPKMQASSSAKLVGTGSDKTPVSVGAQNCPPVTIDLSLVRLPDESKRVIASSPDGEIISSVDIPVEAARPVPEPKVWAAGAVVNPLKQTYGGFVDRDLGWFRTGLQVNQASDIKGIEAWVKAGIIF
jgi:hypothetical protein